LDVKTTTVFGRVHQNIVLPWTSSLPILALVAQAVFLLEQGHRQTHRLRADFTNSGQVAGLLNADYLKPTAKSDSRFTKQK